MSSPSSVVFPSSMSDIDSRPHHELHASLKTILFLYQKEDKSAVTYGKKSVVGHHIKNLSTLFLELDELVQARGKFDGSIQVLNSALPGSKIGLNVAMRFKQYLQLNQRDPPAPFNDPRGPRVSKASPARSPATLPSSESSRKSIDCDNDREAGGEVGEQ